MNQFFRQLSETLKDRQEIRISIKKIEGDLVAVVTPDFKEGTSNIEMSGTPEQFDANFIEEIKKPLSVEKAFTSNADQVKAEIEEEEEEDEPTITASTKKDKPTAKRGSKKAEKTVVEKVEPTPELTETKEEVKEEVEKLPAVESETKTEKLVAQETKVEQTPKEAKQLFDEFMNKGKELFSDRKYKEAETAYTNALNLFPESEPAKKALENATKWVKAIERMNAK